MDFYLINGKYCMGGGRVFDIVFVLEYAEDVFQSTLTTHQAPPPDPAICADYNSNCKAMADGGQCELNKKYMVVSM